MQQIGSLARRILADCKRAKEARDKLRPASGLLGLAKIADGCDVPATGDAAGERLEGSGSLNRQPQHTAREDRGDPAAEGASGSGLKTDGRAELSTLDFVQSFSSQGTARPNSGRFLEGRSREIHAPED